jgi:putative spermidine/putrescine transport system substrate-binding protein
MRKFLMAGAAFAFGVSLSAGVAAQERIVAAHYGGIWGKTIETCMFESFTKATGIVVTPEPGVSTANKAKILQQKGNPAIDIAFIDGGISELALADGTIAVLDPKKIPNLANVIDEGIYKRKDGTIYAVSGGYYAVGIAYNTKEVKGTPSSWWDLWNKDYEGKITMPSPTNAAGVPLFLHWNRLLGGNPSNLDPATAKVKDLKVANYFDASGQGEAALQSGEAIIAAHYASAAWGLADKGLPIAWVPPKEGASSSDIRMHIVEGTKKRDAAERFINHILTPEVSKCMTETLYVAPMIKGVQLSDKAKSRLPYGANGSMKNLVIFNWDEINQVRSSVVENWNKRVVAK